MKDLIVFLLALALMNVSFVLLVAQALGEGCSYKKRLLSAFTLDASGGLFSQGLLWLAIFIPVSAGLSLGWYVWTDYSPDLTVNGFKEFIAISILPLAVISLALPIAGLVSSFHSTKQAATQIREAKVKNKMDSFFMHRRELISFISAIPNVSYFGKITFGMRLHPAIHNRFFKGSPLDGWPVIDQAVFAETNQMLNEAAKYLQIVVYGKNGAGMEALMDYLEACSRILWLARHLEIAEICDGMLGVLIKNADHPGGGADIYTVGTTTEEAIASLRFISRFFKALCDYAGHGLFDRSPEYDGIFGVGARPPSNLQVIETLHSTEIAKLEANNGALYSSTHPIHMMREERSKQP